MLATVETMEEMQENFSDITGLPRDGRRQILAAQFECYLRMITDSPRTEEGENVRYVVYFKMLLFHKYDRFH